MVVGEAPPEGNGTGPDDEVANATDGGAIVSGCAAAGALGGLVVVPYVIPVVVFLVLLALGMSRSR